MYKKWPWATVHTSVVVGNFTYRKEVLFKVFPSTVAGYRIGVLFIVVQFGTLSKDPCPKHFSLSALRAGYQNVVTFEILVSRTV